MSMNKPNPGSSKKRIVKDYENLPEELIAQIKLEYPFGFAQHLVSYMNKEGKKVSALPFETEEVYYLIRMTVQEAQQIIEDDEDYDESGNLRDDFAMENSDMGDEEETSADDDEMNNVPDTSKRYDEGDDE